MKQVLGLDPWATIKIDAVQLSSCSAAVLEEVLVLYYRGNL
jgi:hypothetical protein